MKAKRNNTKHPNTLGTGTAKLSLGEADHRPTESFWVIILDMRQQTHWTAPQESIPGLRAIFATEGRHRTNLSKWSPATISSTLDTASHKRIPMIEGADVMFNVL